jgi:hypothetical protein
MSTVLLLEAVPRFRLGKHPVLTVVADPGNTGNGTIEDLTARFNAKPGIYELRCFGLSPTRFFVTEPDTTGPGTAIAGDPFDWPGRTLDFTIIQGGSAFATGDTFWIGCDRDGPLPTLRIDRAPGNSGTGTVLVGVREPALSGLYVLVCTGTGPAAFSLTAPDGTVLDPVTAGTLYGVEREGTAPLQIVILEGGWATGDQVTLVVENSFRFSHGARVPTWRHVDWPTAIEAALTFEVDAFAGALGLGGASPPGAGTVRLAIGEGIFDRFLPGFYDGRPLRAWIGTEAANGTPENLAPVLTALCLEPTYNESVATLVLRDFAERLAVPIQPTLYSGGGSLDGVEELRNRPKPLAYGDIRVTAPIFVAIDETYQVHDGPCTRIQPEDGGVAFWPANGGANDIANLVSGPIPSGTNTTAPTGGTLTAFTIDLTVGTGTEWPSVDGALVGRELVLKSYLVGKQGGRRLAKTPLHTTCTAYTVVGTIATVTTALTDGDHGVVLDTRNKVQVLSGLVTSLAAWTPVEGQYVTDLSRGFFRLGNPPFGPLTAWVTTPLTTGAAIIRDAVTRQGALDEDTELDEPSFAAFEAATCTAFLALYLTDPTSITTVLDFVMQTLGGLWTFTAEGKLALVLLQFDLGNPVRIEPEEITHLERVRTLLPVERLHFPFGRNYRVLSRDQVGANQLQPGIFVTPFAGEGYAQDAGVEDNRRLARELTVETLFAWNQQGAADAEAARQLALLSNTDPTSPTVYGRDLFEAEAWGHAFTLALGQTVLVTAPQRLLEDGTRGERLYDLDENRPFLVLGKRETSDSGESDGAPTFLRLWG